jgi:single-stranded-DNA-specific exonuclease
MGEALQRQQKLAIAYPPPKPIPPIQVWQQLVGVAKYLSRTGLLANKRQLCEKLELSDRALHLGLRSLSEVGFQVLYIEESVRISQQAIAEMSMVEADKTRAIQIFLDAVCEEQFRQQYFSEVPVSIMRRSLMMGYNVFKFLNEPPRRQERQEKKRERIAVIIELFLSRIGKISIF